ncbi:MAG: hypothetical protein RIT41_1670, partial [Bacteroidota bacterium]
KENIANRLPEKIKIGSYFLSDKDNGIILGEGLADYFKINTGDSLILISQGYHATSAAGIFMVRGIVSLGSPQLNNNLAYTNWTLYIVQFGSVVFFCYFWTI